MNVLLLPESLVSAPRLLSPPLVIQDLEEILDLQDTRGFTVCAAQTRAPHLPLPRMGGPGG